MSKVVRTLLIWFVLLAAVGLIWSGLQEPRSEIAGLRSDEELVADLDAGRVEGFFYDAQTAQTTVAVEGERFLIATRDPALMSRLYEEVGLETETGSSWTGLLTVVVPLLLILALFIYFVRRYQGASTASVLSLTKSPARRLEKSTVRLADVGGCQPAKDGLSDVISFLRDPRPWLAGGARIPRGLLLEGPPGCGKTLLARAVAGETQASFFLISASEFVEMFVGVGAARVRNLFADAAKNAPSVIFIDELDAVGRRRGSGIGSSHDEREQTLNQLLVCLDGAERDQRVVVLAATNRPDILDRALLRPGRFDRRLQVGLPDAATRLEILRLHLRGKTLDPGTDLAAIAARSAGWSGADLESLVNEATLSAVRRSGREGRPPAIVDADLEAGLAERTARERTFDRVDLLLLESASQVSEPSGKACAELVTQDGEMLRGELLWADSAFVKVRQDDGKSLLIAKGQLVKVTALEGTEGVDRAEITPDRWGGRVADTA